MSWVNCQAWERRYSRGFYELGGATIVLIKDTKRGSKRKNTKYNLAENAIKRQMVWIIISYDAKDTFTKKIYTLEQNKLIYEY